MTEEWPRVSVVFVTYKRVDLLAKTVRALLSQTDYPNLELVVADDGSPKSVQEEIRKLPFDRFALSASNRGLGANLNAGLLSATGEYILVLEDDWLCRGPRDYLQKSIDFLRATPNAGLVRYYGYDAVFIDGSPQRMPRQGAYSNTPHLRTRVSLEEVGFYQEGVWMEKCEAEYVRRFAERTTLDTYQFPAYFNQTFLHIGEEQSHRTRSFRVRARNVASRIASPFKAAFPSAFAQLKQLLRKTS